MIEQVLGGTLFLPPPTFDHLCLDRRRLGRIAAHQDFEIVCHPLVSFHGRHTPGPLQTPLLGGVVHREQMISHLGGPCLLFLFGQVETISEQVCPTQTVRPSIGVIADPAIMHRPSTKAWPDTNDRWISYDAYAGAHSLC